MIHRCAYIYIQYVYFLWTSILYHVPIRIHRGQGTCHLGWWLKILGTIEVWTPLLLCAWRYLIQAVGWNWQVLMSEFMAVSSHVIMFLNRHFYKIPPNWVASYRSLSLHLVFHCIVNHTPSTWCHTICMARKSATMAAPQPHLPGGAAEPSPQSHQLCTFESKKYLRLRVLEVMNAECCNFLCFLLGRRKLELGVGGWGGIHDTWVVWSIENYPHWRSWILWQVVGRQRQSTRVVYTVAGTPVS